MKERIGYIDSLKGVAILLMIMGHVISNQFSDWQWVITEAPRITSLLHRVIYSFHMHLLMFCSGLVALHINHYTWKSIGETLWKRACTLLLPFVCSGYLVYLVTDGHTLGYWFLYLLFQFIVVAILIDGLCKLIPKYGEIVSSLVIIISALFVQLYYERFFSYQRLPLVDVGHWRLYPYFCMGVICSRYDLCSKWFSKSWVYTLALLTFGFTTYWVTINGYHIPMQKLTCSILPISAIVSLQYLFKVAFNNNASRTIRALQSIGRYSLEIYIIHVFFLFRLPQIGEFVMRYANVAGGERTVFFVQLVTSFLCSLIIIALTYIVMNIINKSRLLSQVLLGRKGNHEIGD